ncbi:hypothetical protein D3C72_1741030 [compost metagenome]
MVGKLVGQVAVGGVVLGDDHHAARFLVEAVDDAGALDAADARQRVAAMVDQRIDERARPIAGAGMHDKAGRFAQHDKVVVLIEHVERDILALRFRIFGLRQVDLETVARLDLLLRFGHRLAVDRDGALFDQALDAVAGKFARKRLGQEGIEPTCGVLARRQDFPIGCCLFKGVVHSVFNPIKGQS